jgi:hypothetical protein
MATTNPFESPQAANSPDLAAMRRKGRIQVFGMVFLGIALYSYLFVRHWADLETSQLVVGSTMRMVLPLVGAALLAKGKRFGRWLLIGIFGLGSVGGLLRLVFLGTHYGVWYLTVGRYPIDAIAAMYYLLATLWLLLSHNVRSLVTRTLQEIDAPH